MKEETEATERQQKLTEAALVLSDRVRSLFDDPDRVVEIRALRVHDGRNSTWAGTYQCSELLEMTRDVLRLSGLSQGVYYTLNPLKPNRLIRSTPRMRKVGAGDLAHDRDALERRWILVDIDPVRPAETSSTDSEKSAALDVTNRVREYLTAEGWPTPFFCDSGNGYHLLYRLSEPLPVDLPLKPNDSVRRSLVALAAQFDTPAATIDTRVFNPARIVKFPGSLACKGDNTDERPHRRSRVLEVPR